MIPAPVAVFDPETLCMREVRVKHTKGAVCCSGTGMNNSRVLIRVLSIGVAANHRTTLPKRPVRLSQDSFAQERRSDVAALGVSQGGRRLAEPNGFRPLVTLLHSVTSFLVAAEIKPTLFISHRMLLERLRRGRQRRPTTWRPHLSAQDRSPDDQRRSVLGQLPYQ